MPEEIRSIDETLSEEDHDAALRRQFEESKLWREHKRHHEQEGTEARLIVSEEPATESSSEPAPERFTNTEEHTPRKMIPIGWCQCQSPSAKFALGEDGEVKPQVAEAADVKPVYGLGVGSGTSETYGLSQSGPAENEYKRGSAGHVKDLYKG